jgi:hypothetical protein
MADFARDVPFKSMLHQHQHLHALFRTLRTHITREHGSKHIEALNIRIVWYSKRPRFHAARLFVDWHHGFQLTEPNESMLHVVDE